MRGSDRGILNITTDDVSVSYYPPERMGFVGREEGLVAYATVLLKKKKGIGVGEALSKYSREKEKQEVEVTNTKSEKPQALSNEQKWQWPIRDGSAMGRDLKSQTVTARNATKPLTALTSRHVKTGLKSLINLQSFTGIQYRVRSMDIRANLEATLIIETAGTFLVPGLFIEHCPKIMKHQIRPRSGFGHQD